MRLEGIYGVKLEIPGEEGEGTNQGGGGMDLFRTTYYKHDQLRHPININKQNFKVLAVLYSLYQNQKRL